MKDSFCLTARGGAGEGDVLVHVPRHRQGVRQVRRGCAPVRPTGPSAPRAPACAAGWRATSPSRARAPSRGGPARAQIPGSGSSRTSRSTPSPASRGRCAAAPASARRAAMRASGEGGGGGLTAREGVARGLTGALEEKTLREGKDAPRGGSSKWKLSPSLVVRSRTQAHPYPRGRRQADIAYERFLAPEIFFAPEIYNSQYIKPLPVRPSEPSQLNPRASSARALWP